MGKKRGGGGGSEEKVKVDEEVKMHHLMSCCKIKFVLSLYVIRILESSHKNKRSHCCLQNLVDCKYITNYFSWDAVVLLNTVLNSASCFVTAAVLCHFAKGS